MQHRKLDRLMTPVERIARVAASGLTSATSSATRPSGAKSYDNADGTRTIIGNVANGDSNPSYTMATHVGDTTAPGTPTGVTASSKSGVVVVEWDGTLTGGIPDDFFAVRVYLDGSELGILTGAGSVSSASLVGGTTHAVTATAEDDCCLPDGTPAHNVSAPTAVISVTVSEDVEGVAAIAQEALDVAEATGQHFWSDTDGIHVTEVTEEEWGDSADPNYHSGANVLLNALGMLFRRGLTNLMSVLTNGIAIYDGNGNDSTNILAEFTANRIRLGRRPSATEPTYAKVEFFDGDTSLSSSIIPDSEIDGGRRSIFLANSYAVNDLDAYGYLGIAHQIGDDGTNTTENANTTIQAMTGDKNKYAGVSAISISNNGATPSTRVNLHGDYLDLSDGTTNQSFTMANVIEALQSGGVGTASTSITLSNLGSGTKTMYLRRFGNIVVAQMNNVSQVSAANTAYTVGTVPAGYRPAQAAYCSGHCVSNNTIQGMFRWAVATSGSITYICSVTGLREAPVLMTWYTTNAFPS